MEETNTDKTDTKPYLDPVTKKFLPGNNANPHGRPKGSLSVIGRLKQMWEENPQDFEDFVTEYKKDPQNRKHITEMVDGKPKQDIAVQGDINVNVVRYADSITPPL